MGSDDGQDLDFNILRAGITDDMKARTVIEEIDSGALEALLSAINDPSAAETVVILGRASVDMSASFQSPSSREDTRVLGPFATNVLHTIKEKSVQAGLMIVQGKRETEELRRKNTQQNLEG